jgi:hypothetical protein
MCFHLEDTKDHHQQLKQQRHLSCVAREGHLRKQQQFCEHKSDII